MPTDARSLLRAAASERAKASTQGIYDPFASYNTTTGALRCSACSYTPIKHESLWAPHAQSKSHRMNVARIRAEQEERERIEREHQQEAERTRRESEGKRKAEDDQDNAAEENEAKRARTADVAQTQKSSVDPEWERFQKELAGEDSTSTAEASASVFEQATIEVQPILKGQDANEDGAGTGAGDEQEETEQERRARLDREEREEIYSRFEEEQRIQDEAQER